MSLDALTETLATLDGMAAAEPVGAATVGRFLLRTGRPLPRVIVAGIDVAQTCRQVDAEGGDATGLCGPNQLVRAVHDYPGGTFRQADLRAPGLAEGFHDGAWLGVLVNHIAHAQLVPALRGLHAALRPGGLMYFRLAGEATPGWQKTPHGRLMHEAWDTETLAAELGALDFSLVESADGLIFRREY